MNDPRADMAAALAPEALAPPIASSLNLAKDATAAALGLLATGAQPAFVARYRREQIGTLLLRDLERIQARAAAAASFELRRHQLLAELASRDPEGVASRDAAAAATYPVDLEDVRAVRKRRKKGAAAQARRQGLSGLASLLWQLGSTHSVVSVRASAAPIRPRSKAVQPEGAQTEAAPDALKPEAVGADALETEAESEPVPTEASEPALETEAGSEPAPTEASEPALETEAGSEPAPTEASRPQNAATTSEEPVVRLTVADVDSQAEPSAVAELFVATGQMTTAPQALAGARAICLDDLSADPQVRGRLRALLLQEGSLLVGEGAGKRKTRPQKQSKPAPTGEATTGVAAGTDESVSDPPAPTAPPTDDPTGASALDADAGTGAEAAPAATPTPPEPKQSAASDRKDRSKGGAPKERPNRYAKFVGRREPCAKVGSATLLALHRGEREGALSVTIEIAADRVAQVMAEAFGLRDDSPAAVMLRALCAEAWSGALGKAVRNGARKLLKQRVDLDAIGDYCEALRPLLLAPAFGAKPVMGIDPGFQHGCRVAVVDATGRLVASDHVFPLQPKLQAPQAKARIAQMCAQHEVAAIVVTNGGGGREIERLCRAAVHDDVALNGVVVASADADAAGLYASSRIAKEELPGTDTAVRRATSAARRLQDPLSELVKIDVRRLGLGQYQHEVDQEELRAALEQVVTSCINVVSVDLNSASAERLARVVGLSQALAKAIVAHRNRTGPFRTRAQLLEIEGVAGRAFEQAGGFLRIGDGENPLDRTTIHPERYAQVTEMAADLGVTVGDLLGHPDLVQKLDPKQYLGKAALGGLPLGKPTLDALCDQLRSPGADPRPPFEAVEYEPGLASFSDLAVGMELAGVVTHVAGFGAFIDVGLGHEGLVHVSELSHGYVDKPADAVHVGQKVRGKVIDIDPERKRFGMSLRALLARPDRPESHSDHRGKSEGRGRGNSDGRGKSDGRGRGKSDGRGKGDGRGGRDDRRDDRGGGGGRGRGGGPRRDKEDRVLGFNMDLSAFAERLKNG